MPRLPSIGELAESVGILLESALEGGGDGGVGEAGAGSVWRDRRGGLAAFAFSAVAAFFGWTAFLDTSRTALFGAGLLLFDDFGRFAAFADCFAAGFAGFPAFVGFAARFAAFDGFAARFADGFGTGFFGR